MMAPLEPAIGPTDPRLLADPLDYMEAEHYRQRAALAHLERLRPDTPPERRVAIAKLVLAFIRGEVGRHVEDETRDLFPLLRRRCLAEDDVEAVLALAAAEHARDAELARPVADGLERCARREPPGADFPDAIAAFVDSQRRHLAWENAIVLPLARKRLTPTDRKRLGASMAARRGLRRGRSARRAGYFGK